MNKNSQILGDHKRHKSKFIPPAVYMLGGIKETSWIRYGLPELFWISLLHHFHGMRDGADIALQFTKKCAEQCALEPKPLIAATSSFDNITPEAKQRVVDFLNANGIRKKLVDALGGLLAYYPKCPLNFLVAPGELEDYQNPESLSILKSVIKPLFYKLEKEPVFTQATFIYLGFLQDKIKVAAHLPMAKFPEIEKYPDTELSQTIASGVRAMVSGMLGGMDDKANHTWADYFWNRGLEIEPCTHKEAS